MTTKPLPYPLRIAAALKHLRLDPGVTVCRVRHGDWCPMGTGKRGKCRCRPKITIATPQGEVTVLHDGSVRLPASLN